MSKVSDNYFEDFPGRMADGRAFTDYRTNCITNYGLAKDMTSWEYRYYLQNNAAKIVEDETTQRNSLLSYSGPNAPEVPVKNVQNCNKGFCTITPSSDNGIGIKNVTNEFS